MLEEERRVHWRGLPLQWLDLRQASVIAAWRAEASFDETLGVPFVVWLRKKIRWELRGLLRSVGARKPAARIRMARMKRMSEIFEDADDAEDAAARNLREVRGLTLVEDAEPDDRETLLKLLVVLDARESVVVTSRLCGTGLDKVAAALGVSEASVRAIEATGLAKLHAEAARRRWVEPGSAPVSLSSV
jgi:RNA polymerase sigma factor (sigma-70 family)